MYTHIYKLLTMCQCSCGRAAWRAGRRWTCWWWPGGRGWWGAAGRCWGPPRSSHGRAPWPGWGGRTGSPAWWDARGPCLQVLKMNVAFMYSDYFNISKYCNLVYLNYVHIYEGGMNAHIYKPCIYIWRWYECPYIQYLKKFSQPKTLLTRATSLTEPVLNSRPEDLL